MTPEQRVKRCYKTAHLAEFWPAWVIDMPSRRRRAGLFLGGGKTPKAAWANAAKNLNLP